MWLRDYNNAAEIISSKFLMDQTCNYKLYGQKWILYLKINENMWKLYFECSPIFKQTPVVKTFCF